MSNPLDPKFDTNGMVDERVDPPLFVMTADELDARSRAVAAKGARRRKLAAELGSVAAEADMRARLDTQYAESALLAGATLEQWHTLFWQLMLRYAWPFVAVAAIAIMVYLIASL